ncbi:hypothetical protein AHiyo4_15580 [Arthrobacter sp. Hiyo4]|nr:hypothetical protein AHiyo4_15580 [Arthrobacter sp. Hiyo4]
MYEQPRSIAKRVTGYDFAGALLLLAGRVLAGAAAPLAAPKCPLVTQRKSGKATLS